MDKNIVHGISDDISKHIQLVRFGSFKIEGGGRTDLKMNIKAT